MKKSFLAIMMLFLAVKAYCKVLSVPVPYPTIQAAIDAAVDGDIVIVSPGTYTGPGNRDIDFLGKAITVCSVNPNDPCVVAATIIDCNGSETDMHRGFTFHTNEGPDSVLAGLTITKGRTDNGGGIYCFNSKPVITKCIIKGNIADSGGGIGCYYESNPVISNCIITENKVVGRGIEGGGGINCSNSNARIINCIIKGNSSDTDQVGRGGGISCLGWDKTLEIINCTIEGNSAKNSGGGIHFLGSHCSITNCIIKGNYADFGGGITSYHSSFIITDSVISGNSTKYYGSGVLILESQAGNMINTMDVTNCTITDNVAGGDGGGVYYWDPVHTRAKVALRNCIVWDNFPQQIYERYDAIITADYSDVQGGWPGEGNIDVDPLFVQPGYWADANDSNVIVEPNDPNAVWMEGDYHLLTGSPCIDTGDPNYVPEPNETDLDGNPRVVDGDGDGSLIIDMGAYEYQNTVPVADAGPNQVAYAWIDGLAEVTLDSSGSYDDDGDELEYFWWWSIDGNDYEADGVSPTIELPVGEHNIELIVNDGFEDSEPNYTTVSVIGPIKRFLVLTPQAISNYCPQKRIMAKLLLPVGITRDQIDANQKLTLYPGGIEATNQLILPCYMGGAKRLCIFAYFDRDEVLDAIGGNRFVKVYVVGKLKTGQFFYGSNTVRIFKPGRWPVWGNMRQWFGNWKRNYPCLRR